MELGPTLMTSSCQKVYCCESDQQQEQEKSEVERSEGTRRTRRRSKVGRATEFGPKKIVSRPAGDSLRAALRAVA